MKKPLLLAPLALAALSACTPNHASVEFFAICAPPDDATTCVGSATCTAVLANPRVSLATSVLGRPNALVMFVQINNQNLTNADATSGRVNTRDAVIEKYQLSFNGAGVPDVEYPATATIPAGGSQSPLVTIIPSTTSAALEGIIAAGATALVLVDVKAEGRYVDGSRFETGAYRIPVDVSNFSFSPAGCTTAGDVRFFCPNAGQTATSKCKAP